LSRRNIVSQDQLWETLEILNRGCLAQEAEIRGLLRLSPSEYVALRRLRPHETVICQDLARRMRLSLSRASRVIDRLSSRGFVERLDCAADRRCRSLRLTGQGRVVKERIEALRDECESRILRGYSKSRLDGLKKELGDLVAAFSAD
jgi:DNA-binding MarR family transcriptional regulator